MNIKTLVIVACVLLIIWGSFLWFIVTKSDMVRKDPCSICAERVGEDVTCSVGIGGESRTYYTNGTIEDNTLPIYIPGEK